MGIRQLCRVLCLGLIVVYLAACEGSNSALSNPRPRSRSEAGTNEELPYEANTSDRMPIDSDGGELEYRQCRLTVPRGTIPPYTLVAFLDEILPENWDEISKHGPGSEAQADFSKRFCPQLAERGWIVQGDERHFTGDTVSGWSRQYEYAYAAANIDPDDRKILDVGSGYTFFASWLAKRGHQVTCSDLYDLSALYEKSDVEFVRDDICKTGIREQFDCIYCISVLEHIPDKE